MQTKEMIPNPGERRHYLIELGHRPDGTPMGIPMIAVSGRQPGPVLGIIAGLHGDEYEGPEALRSLVNNLDLNSLAGSILCTPAANIPAYENFSRTGWIDHLDLNRSFPGNQEGYLTQQIANALVKGIVEQADIVVDLHSAGLGYDLVPYVGFNNTKGPVGEESFRLAKAFGIPLLYGSTPFANVLRQEAVRREIPALLVEVGGAARVQAEGVELVERGLLNVLKALEMLPGSMEFLPEWFTLIEAPPEGEFMHVRTGGFVRNHTELEAMVQAGDLLATIIDVYGNELDQVISPIDGLVLSYRTIPVIRTGEWGYSVVRIVGTADYDTSLDTVQKRLLHV
ncbi:MAG: succinylglutamate desuccinylase/aspartoacylase family protein [Thermomicrobiales bacterium]|nr:succinylglutamate desuccinylase/aspartoacylase family protein [Thermomicrobiales bacterium]